MARGRMLDKSISASYQINGLPDWGCKCLATWLISHLDKNGVFYGDAPMVRSQVFPLEDVTNEQVEEWLQAMERAIDESGEPLIRRFTARSRVWLYFPGFDRHQKGLHKDREQSTFPELPTAAEIPALSGKMPEASGKMPEASGEMPATVGKMPEASGEMPATVGKMPDADQQLPDKGNLTQPNVTEVEANADATRAADAAPALPEEPELPLEPAPQGPVTFQDWVSRVEQPPKGSNRTAVLVQMANTLFPGRDPPAFGLMGKAAKDVGGAGYMAELLWTYSTKQVRGDPVAYILAAHNRNKAERKNGNGSSRYGDTETISIQGHIPRAATSEEFYGGTG